MKTKCNDGKIKVKSTKIKSGAKAPELDFLSIYSVMDKLSLSITGA